MDYEIVIVGGGPAGLSAAYSASKAKTLVIEKDNGIGVNVRTSGVSWINDMKRYGIDEEYYNPIKRYRFYSPSNEVTIEDKEYRACVLDVRKVYQYLAELAVERGAEMMVNTRAVKAVRDINRIKIVAKHNNKEITINSKLVIDASGFNSVIARDLNIAKAWGRYGVGAEYECYAENVEVDTWALMVGSIYTPSGYAWTFPISNNKIRIGVGVARPESNADPLELLDDMIRRRIKPLDKMGKIKPLELHYGFIPNEGIRDNIIDDRLMLVGDAAGQANPLVLEGIRYAIEFGRLAGEVGVNSLAYDASKEYLIRYENESKKIKKQVDSALRVQRRWLSLSDKGWDKEIEVIKDMSIDELLDFIRAEFTPKKMLKLAIEHPMLVARELFRMVIKT